MAVNEHNGAADDARLARLYRDAAREEPPSRLDRVLAAAAREGVQRPARERASSWWTPWRLPFAFAAVTVVCVSLATLMIEEDTERVAAVPSSPPSAAYEREDAKPAQRPAEAPASTADGESSPAPASNAATAQAPGARAPQRQGSQKLEGAPVAGASGQGPAERARSEAPAAAIEADRRAMQKAPAPEAALQAAPGGLAAADPRVSGEVQAPRPEDRAFAPPPAAAAKPAPAAPPQPATAEKARAPDAKPAPAPRRSIGVRGLESDGSLQARPSPEVARHIAELDTRPPSAWIERVLTLRREGRRAEADGVLAEFRRRYPAEPLPAELQ